MDTKTNKMKKESLKGKLRLKRDIISKLTNNQLEKVNGGADFPTRGCTDGCTGRNSLQTLINCTNADCTNNCHACE